MIRQFPVPEVRLRLFLCHRPWRHGPTDPRSRGSLNFHPPLMPFPALTADRTGVLPRDETCEVFLRQASCVPRRLALALALLLLAATSLVGPGHIQSAAAEPLLADSDDDLAEGGEPQGRSFMARL